MRSSDRQTFGWISGDKAELLEQSLFLKMLTKTTNVDELRAALKQAFTSCTSVFPYVFPYAEEEDMTATGYAQICFSSPESKVHTCAEL